MGVTQNYQASVKDFVQRVASSGDIHFRFSSRSNALDGIKGHQKLQKSRPDGYIPECSVEDQLLDQGINLIIKGRADGYIPDLENFLVEEIKTIRVSTDKIPVSVSKLHWAQLEVYGCLLARQHEVKQLTLRLTYYHIDEQREYNFDTLWLVEDLEARYEQMAESYLQYLRQLLAWRAQRDASIEQMSFPYDEFRAGQRQMAVSVYRSMQANQQLVLQAPTGIGKTMASLFPAVKALRELSYDKVFYLSAKTSGQQMAQTAVQDMKQQGLLLRDVSLTAKEKICFNPGTPCDPDYCEYARGYYDKLPAVVTEVVKDKTSLTRDRIETLAREASICPFELSLDLSELADLVICDYNYVFDPGVYLRRYFDEKPMAYGLLMDESHNLVDRGRDMFSATFEKDDVLALKNQVKAAGFQDQVLIKALDGINREILAIIKPLKPQLKQSASAAVDQFPESLFQKLRRFNEVAESCLEEAIPREYQAALLQLYFDALRFIKVMESAESGYAHIISQEGRGTRLKLFCLNPGPGLALGFERMKSSICFSATLSPQPYFNTLMGVNEAANWYQIPSPFDPDKFGVFVTSFISTTYQQRNNSLYDLVDLIATVIKAKAGNYLVFFPSHAYLGMVQQKFVERHPEVSLLVQQPIMADEERSSFLDGFKAEEQVLGFAVMGGIFAEGIDLKGSRLIGAIVVGVGLPQVGVERNLIRQYFDQPAFEGAGFEYAYQYPGMNKVLQTAGRVIRSETDKGIVCLVDHRFNESRYQRLFPENWQPQQVKNLLQLEQKLGEFWR